jgi:hypothetical protein
MKSSASRENLSLVNLSPGNYYFQVKRDLQDKKKGFTRCKISTDICGKNGASKTVY